LIIIITAGVPIREGWGRLAPPRGILRKAKYLDGLAEKI